MVTIRDVSAAAGVSPTTVSRVMNGRDADHVGDATRERVLAAAERLGYRPSAAARALVGGRTRVVALSCPVVYTTWFAIVLEETQRILDRHNYYLLMTPSAHQDELKDLLRERRVDAAIWALYPVERVTELAEAIVAPHQRIAGVGSIEASPPPACCVAWWDDAVGTRQAIDHLAALGHRNIAYLSGTRIALELWPNTLAAFERTCDAHGVRHSVVHSDAEHPYFAAGVQMALRALELCPRPTALFARNDDFAFGVLSELAQVGVDVPGEMSVIGYNDIPLAAYTHPALTTVYAPIVEATRAVVGALVQLLHEDTADAALLASRHFATRLVVRDSTGPPPVQQRRRS